MTQPGFHPPSIIPSLSYDDAPAAIEWLCRAFGFTKRLVVPGAPGIVRHAELSLGSGVIMVSSARSEMGRLSPQSLNGVNQGICVHVDDADGHFAVARDAGAEILQELKDEDFGSRGYMVKDCEGHHWYFGTYVPGAYWDGNVPDAP